MCRMLDDTAERGGGVRALFGVTYTHHLQAW